MRARGQNNFSVMNEEPKRYYKSMLHHYIWQVFAFILIKKYLFFILFLYFLCYDKNLKIRSSQLFLLTFIV
jgi:hypothetical protein